VLIHAASDGIGHYAVQMAKTLGAYVAGASYLSKKEFILELGADEYYNYQDGNG
jgi:NADPH:quinone reductase-like Zn-dependent oxidoreductase